MHPRMETRRSRALLDWPMYETATRRDWHDRYFQLFQVRTFEPCAVWLNLQWKKGGKKQGTQNSSWVNEVEAFMDKICPKCSISLAVYKKIKVQNEGMCQCSPLQPQLSDKWQSHCTVNSGLERRASGYVNWSSWNIETKIQNFPYC